MGVESHLTGSLGGSSSSTLAAGMDAHARFIDILEGLSKCTNGFHEDLRIGEKSYQYEFLSINT